MRALITGIGGFVGGHLASLLLREGFEVWGIDRQAVLDDGAAGYVAMEVGDLCNLEFVCQVVRDARPTHVFHFAWEFAQDPTRSAKASKRNMEALYALIEAIDESRCKARLLIASSSAVYGDPDRQLIDEESPVKPTTAYGFNKAAVEEVAKTFHSGGFDIVVARTFNLLGPGMPRRLFAGSLAAQIAAAERRSLLTVQVPAAESAAPTAIKVGRLNSSRDYVDVRDAARAYLDLATQPSPGHWVFNVCSGVAHGGRELADEMLALAKVKLKLDYDESRLQSGDVDCQQGSAERLRGATGWMPTIPFSQSVRDTLDHERKSWQCRPALPAVADGAAVRRSSQGERRRKARRTGEPEK